MAFYDKFPYTNFQELNLDWLTQEVSKVRDNRDASDASAAAALSSEQAAAASAQASAESAAASAESATEAAGSASEAAASKDASAEYLEQIGTHTAGAAADWLKENLTPTTPPVDASLTVSGAAADAKKTGDEITDLKSAINELSFVDGIHYIKELYINSAGVSGGVTKLHQVYTSLDGSPSYFMLFSNGTEFTGHTEATATPDYGVLTIYSGKTGTSEIYGYAIVDWGALSAGAPIKDLKPIAYKLDFSPRISCFLGVDNRVKALEGKTAYEQFAQITPDFALVSTDYNMDDAEDSTNRFITSKAFFCKGKVKIEIDSSFVNAGFKIYVMSKQSGRLNKWEASINITTPIIELEYDDTIRVSIFQSQGISAYYHNIVNTTRIYTLTESAYSEFMRNKIIGSKKIWCFGDSLTAGVITGTTTITESYPYWLNKFLGENVDISNFGVPGDTSQNMRDIITSKTFYGNCDIAILMIGTNGFMIGSEEDTTTPIGAYHQAIKHIIDSSKGTTKIIIMNPPKSERNGVPQRWLDSMHYRIEKIAQNFNLDCIDLYTFLPFAPDNTTYYSSDKTHFTAIGYYWIAYIVYQYLTTHMTAQQIGGNPTFDH